MEYVNKTRTGLEVCPTSNVDTGAVAAYGTSPIRRFLQEDLRITVGTDNRTISRTNITQEYLLLMEHLGFTQEDIFKLGRNGIKSAFLDSRTMKAHLNAFDEYVAKVKGKK